MLPAKSEYCEARKVSVKTATTPTVMKEAFTNSCLGSFSYASSVCQRAAVEENTCEVHVLTSIPGTRKSNGVVRPCCEGSVPRPPTDPEVA